LLHWLPKRYSPLNQEQAEKEKRQKIKEDRLKQHTAKTENLKRLNEKEIGGIKKKQATTKLMKPLEPKIQTPKAQIPAQKPVLKTN
jgi:molecular chaperone GrpE (heat shock protein)